ncbi:vgrg protein [Clostridium thermarum]|uniref:VgrG-related protein n=1 Tax=Clostridium thermarum TaxID=1716543 RepID=UPI001122325A|nr:vgrg protein [Clostridium thermarum]
MNISSLYNKLAMLSLENLTPDNSESSVAAEEKLAILAFQQVYEMMLNGSSNSSLSDMQSELMNELISQQADGNVLSLESSLSMLGDFNISSRSYTDSYINYDIKSNYSYSAFDISKLSSKYESNGNPGVIANNPGDYGGKSYGAWQFSSRTGSLNSFVNYLKDKNEGYYYQLISARAADGNSYGVQFDKVWTTFAKEDRETFLNLQESFIKENFYDAAAEGLREKYNFDISNRSTALKNVLWSTVVQHGVKGAIGIFSKTDLTAGDDTIISQVYDERQRVNVHFKSSSASIRKSVYNRFEKERAEALALLQNEKV